MSLSTALIIIGDEILEGRTRDSNGYWLARRLKEVGLGLSEILVVSDNLADLSKLFKDCLAKYRVIFISGGLGPTLDDVTKQALADATSNKILESSQGAEMAKENYLRYGKEWTPVLNSYHMVPENFNAVTNPKGLAPGLVYCNENSMLLAAPGVPWEFEEMVDSVFLPILKKEFPKQLKRMQELVICTRFIPEEKIFGELCPNLWKDLSAFGKVSSLPQVLGINIIVRAADLDEEKRDQIVELINSTELSEYVWQYGSLSLPELIIKKACEKGLSIGMAESCTGGLSASRLTDIPGSSAVFMGSLVTYSNQAKEKLLGVKEKTLLDHGAVSTETVEEMALGAREKLACDFAIAFSGIAGPGGGSDEKPVGTLAFALSGPNQTYSKLINYRGDRLKLKNRFSEFGLFKLLEALS